MTTSTRDDLDAAALEGRRVMVSPEGREQAKEQQDG